MNVSSSIGHLLVSTFFVLLWCSLCLGFKPDETATWVPCPEITPLRSFHQDNLQEFKKHFFEKYVNKEDIASLGTVPVKIPKNDVEWLKLLDALKMAECTIVNFPLLWNKPEDPRSVKYFVKRFKAKKETPKGMLFFLQGGPGAPGTAFDSHSPQFMDLLDQEWDILIPDHRGTGRSSHLHCSQSNTLHSNKKEEIEACISELMTNYTKEGIYGWSTRQAAEDIRAFANLYKKPGQKVVVYGVSYGTYLVNKLLNLFPDSVDGAITDSNVKMDTDFSRREMDYEENGNNLVQTCQNSTFCRSKFLDLNPKLSNVVDVFTQIFQNQKDTASPFTEQCMPFMYQSDDLRMLFSSVEADFDLRRLIFPLLYRLGRCNLNDKRWLANFYLIYRGAMEGLKKDQSLKTSKRNFAPDQETMNGPAFDSDEIMLLIITAELNDLKNDRKYEEYLAKYTTYPPFFRMPMENLLKELQTIGDRRYDLEKPKELALNYKGPLLMFQGTLDPQTPPSYGRSWESAYSGMPKKYFYWFRNAVHAAAFRSPLKAQKDLNCGCLMMADFIKKIGAGIEDPRPSETALRCWRQDEYIDASEFDFKNFFYDYKNEDEFAKLNIAIQAMKPLFLLDVDLWDGGPMLSVLDAFGVLIAVLGGGMVLCCSLCVVCICGCCVLIIGAILLVVMILGVIKARSKRTNYEKTDDLQKNEDADAATFETKKLINKSPDHIYETEYNDGSINYENA